MSASRPSRRVDWLRMFDAEVYAVRFDLNCLKALRARDGDAVLERRITELQGIIAAIEEGTWCPPDDCVCV